MLATSANVTIVLLTLAFVILAGIPDVILQAFPDAQVLLRGERAYYYVLKPGVMSNPNVIPEAVERAERKFLQFRNPQPFISLDAGLVFVIYPAGYVVDGLATFDATGVIDRYALFDFWRLYPRAHINGVQHLPEYPQVFRVDGLLVLFIAEQDFEWRTVAWIRHAMMHLLWFIHYPGEMCPMGWRLRLFGFTPRPVWAIVEHYGDCDPFSGGR